MYPGHVKVTDLGTPHSEVRARIAGRAGRRIRLIASRPLPLGASVRVDGSDFLLLGEICHSEKEGQEYVAYLTLEHITSDSQLASMLAKVTRASGAAQDSCHAGDFNDRTTR